jgi:CelD/BcsL family acetyltransferase involved in cellulose biosynthesis
MDPAWAKSSVGMIALGCTIEHSIHTGHQSFDFLRGTQAFKLLWAKDRRPALTAHYFDKRLASRTVFSALQLRDLASRAKRGLRRILRRSQTDHIHRQIRQ